MSVLLLCGITACAAAPEFQKTCKFAPDIRLSTFGYVAFAVEAGLPVGFLPANPQLIPHSPNMDAPTREIALRLAPQTNIPPPLLDRSGCRNIRWHYYMPEYDEAEWREFWSRTDSEHFTAGFSFSDGPAAVPARSYGLAIFDRDSASLVFSCGCYAL